VLLVDYQYEVLQDATKNILLHGGRGSGKTRTLCTAAYIEACDYPGAKLCMVCNDHVQLRDSTLEALFSFLKDINCAYYYKKQDKKILFPNGSSITMLTFEKDKTSLKGAEWDAAFIDEADGRNTTEEKWDYLIDGVRGKVGSRRIFASCNPVPPGHFLAKRFFVAPIAQHVGYKVSTYMNEDNLPDDYVTRMESKYPVGTDEHSRWMLGEMISLSGAVYKAWGPELIVAPANIPSDIRAWGYGLDLGIRDPLVFLEGGVDNRGILYITREYYKPGLTITDHSPTMKKMYREGWPVFADHSARDHADMKNLGWRPINAYKNVQEGIDMVSHRINNKHLFVSSECPRLIEAMYNYTWREGGETEKPDHKWSHAPDALRYLISGLDRDSLFT